MLLKIFFLFNVVTFSFITLTLCFYHSLGIYWYRGLVNNLVYFDGITILMLLLTSLIFSLVFLYIYKYTNFCKRTQVFLVCLIELLIILSFSVDNILIFYMLFESVLIPMFILIGLWGSRGRKLHAAYQFFFFTFFSSFFILMGILLLYFFGGSLNFTDFPFFEIPDNYRALIAIFFFIGFMSKIPTMPLHIWLPEAHVEAPTIGSVILASILLKFGFYGMIRTIPIICDSSTMSLLFPFFSIFCVISLLYGSLSAIRQIDLKKIIAYSSIAHMNFSLLGLFVQNNMGLFGSTFLMLSHGLISGAMFFSVGFLYERFHVRNILYYGGLVQNMPIFCSMFLIIMFSNMSLPGTCNFVGEFVVFLGVLTYSKVIFVLSSFSIILVAIFSLMILMRIFFYQISGFLTTNVFDLSIEEFFILFVLLFHIICFGLFPNMIFDLLFFL